MTRLQEAIIALMLARSGPRRIIMLRGPLRPSKAKAKQHQVSVPWAARTLTGAKRAAVINRG